MLDGPAFFLLDNKCTIWDCEQIALLTPPDYVPFHQPAFWRLVADLQHDLKLQCLRIVIPIFG